MLYSYEEFGSKIERFVALSPPLYVDHIGSEMMKAMADADFDRYIHKRVNALLFFRPSHNCFDKYTLDFMPAVISFFPRATWAFVQGLIGFNEVSHMDVGRMPMMARNDVSSTSTQNLAHWTQLVRTGKIETFAADETRRIPYEIGKLRTNLKSTKMLIFRGTTDGCVVEADFAKLIALLPASQIKEIVTVKDYNHLDYMWAKDVDSKINGKLLAFIMDG